jgi:3-phenylpropionate/trans-cinnamate dioxygenase ferredoxin subunit
MQAMIAPLADLPDGRGVRVELAGSRIAVFRLGDTVHAIGDRCSHAEASLSEGEVFGGEVECPRHGSPFDLTTGEPQALPATEPVPVYPATVRDGVVYLTVGEES